MVGYQATQPYEKNDSWLVVEAYPSEKIWVKVSWNEYSQLNGKIKFMFQTTNRIKVPWDDEILNWMDKQITKQ